jgi:hypothetical protein
MPVFPPEPAPLDALPAGDLSASTAWFATTALHALPPDTTPDIAEAHGLWLALRRDGRRLSSLTTPYTQSWGPVAAPAADWRAAGRALAPLWRGRPPGRLEMLDPAQPRMDDFLTGLRDGGIIPLRHAITTQWYHQLAPDTGWDAYLATRPSALRNTIRRKSGRGEECTLIAAPGHALETAIGEFHAVRAASWKPQEPFPDFDAALMRAAAPLGALRLGVLRQAGRALAAQYWLLDRGGTRALVPKLFHVEEARAASPGTVLTAFMLRHLLQEDRVRELDFGRGDDAYKRLWTEQSRPRSGVLLADPRHPAGLLALARHAAGRLRARLR